MDKAPDLDKMTNHELIQHLIKKHGYDRYPTIDMQFKKLIEEVGELSKELNKPYSKFSPEKVRLEGADVVLSMYRLMELMGFDLDQAMRQKVRDDNRKFKPEMT